MSMANKPAISELMAQRILVLEGAMGTMIQAEKLDEAGYRGQRFADHGSDLRGNNDLLNLTQPEIIERIHDIYLSVGSDIIESNTFNGTTISQADYSCEAVVDDINREGRTHCPPRSGPLDREKRRISRAMSLAIWGRPTAPALSRQTSTVRVIAPSPTTKCARRTCNRPAHCMKVASMGSLSRPCSTTLNCKAALFALEELFDEIGQRLASDCQRHCDRPDRPQFVGPDSHGILVRDPPFFPRSPLA